MGSLRRLLAGGPCMTERKTTAGSPKANEAQSSVTTSVLPGEEAEEEEEDIPAGLDPLVVDAAEGITVDVMGDVTQGG